MDHNRRNNIWGCNRLCDGVLTVAITKHNKTVKKKQQAQANLNQNKKDLGKQQLGKKQAEAKKAHLGDELKATQKKLKAAEKYKQDNVTRETSWRQRMLALKTCRNNSKARSRKGKTSSSNERRNNIRRSFCVLQVHLLNNIKL